MYMYMYMYMYISSYYYYRARLLKYSFILHIVYKYLPFVSSCNITEESSRFYAAEVLLALEYLHMMGFIYRGIFYSYIVSQSPRIFVSLF